MKLPSQFIVVDDDPFNNMVSKYVIANAVPDADILLFNDPEQALDEIRKESAAAASYADTVLFLDINMPAMSGWEFLDEIGGFAGEQLSHISIYILSSSIDPKDARNAQSNALVQGYLSKPLTREVLNAVLMRRSLPGDRNDPSEK